MKNSFKSKVIPYSCIVVFSIAFLFSSCENFLNGSDVTRQLEETIAYSNAKNISISLSCKEEMGIILPENTVSGKLGYNIELQFIPNTSNYAVINSNSLFEAVSRKDNSVSRSDCVEFTPDQGICKSPKRRIGPSGRRPLLRCNNLYFTCHPERAKRVEGSFSLH